MDVFTIMNTDEPNVVLDHLDLHGELSGHQVPVGRAGHTSHDSDGSVVGALEFVVLLADHIYDLGSREVTKN